MFEGLIVEQWEPENQEEEDDFLTQFMILHSPMNMRDSVKL